MRKAPVNSLFSRAGLDFTRAFHLSTTALLDAPGVRVVELPQCNEFRTLCRCAWCFRKQRSRRERWLFGREHVSESRGARGEFYTARFIAPQIRVARKPSIASMGSVGRESLLTYVPAFFSSCRHTLRALREGGCSSAECAETEENCASLDLKSFAASVRMRARWTGATCLSGRPSAAPARSAVPLARRQITAGANRTRCLEVGLSKRMISPGPLGSSHHHKPTPPLTRARTGALCLCAPCAQSHQRVRERAN